MKTVSLIATKSFRYGTRRLKAGDPVECSAGDARLLLAVKKAREPGDERAPLAPPPPTLRARLEAASTGPIPDSSPPADPRVALRARYAEVIGRPAFTGWAAEVLQQKIDAHLAAQAAG